MDPLELPDAVLTVRCQLGDKAAWNALVYRWHPKLWRFISRMLSDRGEAEDVLQSVWLQIVRSLVNLREPERLGPWLYSLARRTIADRLRQLYRHPPPEEFHEVIDWDNGLERFDAADAVKLGLSQLHPVDREAIVLHYLEDLPVAEVADICGVPPGTIKSRLHRARRTFHKTLTR